MISSQPPVSIVARTGTCRKMKVWRPAEKFSAARALSSGSRGICVNAQMHVAVRNSDSEFKGIRHAEVPRSIWLPRANGPDASEYLSMTNAQARVREHADNERGAEFILFCPEITALPRPRL